MTHKHEQFTKQELERLDNEAARSLIENEQKRASEEKKRIEIQEQQVIQLSETCKVNFE